jgi:phosphate transport system substrate-binding protein
MREGLRRTATLRRLTTIAITATTFAALLLSGVTPVGAVGPTVTGAGSTWVQVALDQWRADIARQGYTINYQSVGSSTGRQFFIANQVDFAASEIPFQPTENPTRAFQYLPDVAGGTSIMYNLHAPDGSRITSLKLDANAVGGIFTGVIKTWQDPAITNLNPGLQIADTTLTPVLRSDGSGTSAQLSLYLASQAPAAWNHFLTTPSLNGDVICPAPCSNWPQVPGSQQQAGSDGVANYVANDAIGRGSVGYVETAFAIGRGFPVAWLHNASGHYAQPTSQNVATALQHATLNPDLTQNLGGVYTAPELNAYPMSSYSYMITQTAGFDPAKGGVLGTWLIYIACGGQKEAAPLGYSPLPKNLVQDVFNAVQRIPGAPSPPPLDAAHCPNPNLVHPTTLPFGAGHGLANTVSSTTTAATSAAAAAAANPDEPSAVSGPSVSAIATMSAAQRAASFALAEQAAARAMPQPTWPLFVTALGIVLAVFLPALLVRRRAGP